MPWVAPGMGDPDLAGKSDLGQGCAKPTGSLLSWKQQEAGHGLSPRRGSLQLNIDKGGLFLRDG